MFGWVTACYLWSPGQAPQWWFKFYVHKLAHFIDEADIALSLRIKMLILTVTTLHMQRQSMKCTSQKDSEKLPILKELIDVNSISMHSHYNACDSTIHSQYVFDQQIFVCRVFLSRQWCSVISLWSSHVKYTEGMPREHMSSCYNSSSSIQLYVYWRECSASLKLLHFLHHPL